MFKLNVSSTCGLWVFKKYDLLEQHYSKNFNFLHNLIHDCNDMHEMISNNQQEELIDKIYKLTEITIKEYNSIYTNYSVLNNIINYYLSDINDNNIKIKSVILYNEFHLMDLQTQIDLFMELINLSIQSCKSETIDSRIIIIKTISTSHQIIIQFIFSGILYTNNKLIENNLKKILKDITYDLSIRQIDTNKTDLVIYFNKE